MKTSYLQKVTLFIIFCLFCFSAKTSNAQLVAGDLAIIGVNAEPTVTATPRATISFVALTEIPSGTVVHLTDIGYTGSAFVLAPVPPGTTSPDGTANWTVSTKVPAGTVFTVTIQTGVIPSVSILPSTYGTINLDPLSWSHAVAAPIPINAGDTWFLYTGTKTSPDFIYGFTNAKNPDLDEIDESTGWTKDGKTPKNQSSTLPAALKTAEAYTSLISFKTVDQQRDFNAYSGTFSGSKASLLAQIKNTGSWTTTDVTTEVKDLTPGAPGGAFTGPQPIYKLGSSVLSVIADPNAGQFGIGGTVTILVKFNDLVNVVSGTPRLKLNSGINTYATYASGTGTNTLTFNYTVATGESSPDLNYTSTNALELNGAVLEDPQGDDAILQLPALVAGESLAGTSNILIDGVPATVTAVTSTPANKSYRSGDVISLKVSYSETISVSGELELRLNMAGKSVTLSSGTSNSMTFNYTVQPGDNIARLDYLDVNALALVAAATVKDALGNPAILTLPAPGAAGSLADNNISIDTTTPTVASVSGTSGTYKIGSTAAISINFSENVTVTGTPLLALNVGTPAGNATFASGNGTSTLIFNYTVAAGQTSPLLDYTSTTALSLNGGSVKDAAGNDAILTLASPGAVGSLSNGQNIVINGIPPTVSSIVRTTPTTALTNAASVVFTVTFSEAVSGVDQTDLILSTTGVTSGASISTFSGSGTTYTATVNTGTGDGTLKLGLASSGTGITNSIGNPIQAGYSAGEVYTIDKTEPTLALIEIQSNSTVNSNVAKAGDIITLNFSTSEPINTPVLNINGNTASLTNPSGNNWVATYTTQATDNDGLVPFSIAYSDLAGNTGTPRGTTTNSSSVTFSKTAPTLTAVTIASNNLGYTAYAKPAALVTLTFTASKNIQTPTVTIGGATITALPMGGFSWTAMYTLPSGLAEGAVPFTINYSDAFGNAGTEQTTVMTGSMVTLDKTIPTLSNVSISSNNPNTTLAKPGDQLTLTFTASEGLRTPTVLFNGMTADNVVSAVNNVWTATYILGPTNNEGLISFGISYSDFAGNAGTAVTATNDASTVTYDRTLPDAPNFVGVQAGDQQNTITWFLNPDYAKYELIGGATGGLGNNVLTTVLAANATNPMTFTQTGLTNFQTYYYALRVTDAAGNSVTSYTANGIPLNAQTITFDQPIAAEYGSSFTINATSSSGLPVTLTSNEPALATISGNTVTVVGVNNLQSVSIIATQPGNGTYSYAQPVVRLLQILPKPVTVTATAQTKVFGDVEPALAAPTISPALIGTDVSTGTLSRVSGENAGTYEIQQNTFNLDPYKYAITYVPANFTISKKAVTITAVSNSKTYGDTDPVFAYTGTPALISGEVYSGMLGRAIGENVGNYSLNLGSLKVSDNYSLTLNPGTELLINKKVINVLADSKSKVYGSADPVLSYTPTPALVNNDVFSGALGRAPGENKGTYATTPGNLSAGSNYNLSFSPANLTINAAPLTLTADAKSKFVGTANPVFTGQYTGFVNGEDASVLTSPAVYNSVATVASPIGTYPIVPSGAAGANYVITFVNGLLTVKPGAPTSIALAATTLYENQAAGTKAGTLSSTSEDPNATFTYSLVSGSGDTDNTAFRIVNDQLVTAASLDYENKKTYSVVVRSTTQYGFSLDKSFSINLSDVNEIPTLDAIANKTICYTTAGQTIDLTGISAGPELGQNTKITVTGSNAALLKSLTVSPSGAAKGTISYRVKDGASGVSTITITVKDDGGIDNGGVDTYSRTFVLTVNALPIVAISANTGENNNANSTSVSKGETVVLTASGGSNYVWALHNSVISGQNSGILTVRPRETTTYTVTVSNANGCSEQKSFTVNVLDDMEKIKATNILSPNGDGYNDKWIIENIDFYPNNEVKIFDKSGRMVYSKKSYDNSWDGMLNGMPLSEGTYYYLIDFGKNLRKFKGFITIIREN